MPARLASGSYRRQCGKHMLVANTFHRDPQCAFLDSLMRLAPAPSRCVVDRSEGARQLSLAEQLHKESQARMLVAVWVKEQNRARPQRRREDQPAVGAEYDKMIAAYGLHERRVRYETGKAEKDGGRLPIRNKQPLHIQNF